MVVDLLVGGGVGCCGLWMCEVLFVFVYCVGDDHVFVHDFVQRCCVRVGACGFFCVDCCVLVVHDGQ